MYGLPPDFNPDILIGYTLEMICYSQTDLYLHFGEDITITVGSHIEFDNEIYQIPMSDTNIVSLIGKQVIRSIASEGNIKVYFDELKSLTILDSSSSFESYSIKIGDRTIFV